MSKDQLNNQAHFVQSSRRSISLQVDTNKLHTYLSYMNASTDDLDNQFIGDTIKLAENRTRALSKYLCLDCETTPQGMIECKGTSLFLPPANLDNQAISVDRCVIFACTIGMDYERLLNQSSISSPLQTMILDACGSALVESLADIVEAEISDKALKEGLYAGQRRSPGYAGLDFGLTSSILKVLQADTTLGITTTTSGFMLPRKSITAIIYLFSSKEEARSLRYSCDNCTQYSRCKLRCFGKRCYT